MEALIVDASAGAGAGNWRHGRARPVNAATIFYRRYCSAARATVSTTALCLRAQTAHFLHQFTSIHHSPLDEMVGFYFAMFLLVKIFKINMLLVTMFMA